MARKGKVYYICGGGGYAHGWSLLSFPHNQVVNGNVSFAVKFVTDMMVSCWKRSLMSLGFHITVGSTVEDCCACVNIVARG